MKRTRILAGAAAGVFLAVSATTGALAADMTLKLAGVLPVEHYGHKMLEQIKADIEGANVGLTVKYFPAGQLGSGEELLEDTIRGNIDIVHAFVYAHKDPVLEVNSLPFLVGSWDELARVYGTKDSAYSQIMAETLDRLGLKFLGNVAEGFIGVVSTKKPENYASVGPKGIHIRVWSSQVAKDTTESIGFKTTTMNWAEVFAAVQSGRGGRSDLLHPAGHLHVLHPERRREVLCSLQRVRGSLDLLRVEEDVGEAERRAARRGAGGGRPGSVLVHGLGPGE